MANSASPLVSVICTVKNGSKTIATVLESVQRQTLHEWEMIVVDDGSTDDTSKIVREYADADSRIRLISTDGVGRGRALNLALAHARAEHVANIDADDPCHPMRLEIQYRVLKDNDNESYAVVGTNTVLFFDNELPQWMDIPRAALRDVPVVDVTQLLARLCPVNHSSVLMKRSALEHVGGYDEERRSQYDYDLWVRLAEAGYRIGRIDLPLSGKRIHQGQQFERRRRLKYLLSSAAVQHRAIRVLGGGPIDYIYLVARPLWGLLPNWLRMTVRKMIDRT